MKRLECFYAQKPTVPLAHYTSASGLSGILSSKSLWATHIRFLNDSKEFVHAVGLAREYLKTLRSRPSTTTNGLLTDRLFDHLDAMLGNTWIVSFSENGNLLSQWRGYCPTGGYVINFQPKRLEALADQQKQKFILAKCTYSRDEQFTLVKLLIDATYESFKEYRAPSLNANLSEDDSRVDYFCSKWFFPKMHRLGSLMKDPDFFEEKEWRLIGGLYEPYIIPSYRCNAPLVIPHQVFNLALQGALDDVMESITIGPMFDQELAELGLFFFTQNAGVVGHISTKRSAIPFRQTK